MSEARKIVVIGAGIVGAFTARELLRDGHDVTILDAQSPGGRQAASYGNGAWIMESSLLPVSVPGLWRAVPGYLADPLGPFSIRWSYLMRLAPWLWRFVRSGSTVEKVNRTASLRHALTHTSLDRYRAAAGKAGLSDLLREDGHLFVYPDRRAFENDALTWRIRAGYGFEWQEFEGMALREFEPGLGPGYGFGAYVPSGANLVDPGAFVAGLVDEACAEGAHFRQVPATGFRFAGSRLEAVETEAGEIACEKAVIAAGIRGSGLASRIGDHIPLETERGYHVVVADPAYVPRRPIMPMDGRMAITMTTRGLRVAGQVELAGQEAEPDWRRASVLQRYLARVLPEVAARLDASRIDRWMGHRPSTPDGIPCIGFSRRSPDVVHAFGHGHSGITMAPVTGRLAADLCGGRAPLIDPEPYGAGRFQ